LEKPFPAYQGDEPYVFVCYAHEDSDVVYPEIARLHEQGINLWYDEGISAGQNWRAAIGESLLGANRVLFYISRQSLESDHCDREINLALDKGKEIVPVYLEDVELTPDLMVGLTRVQALHRDQDASYQQHLLNALGRSTPTVKPQEIGKTEDTHSLAIRRGGYLVGVLLLFVIGFIAVQQFRSSDVATIDDKSIAVLPLENLSPDPDNAYFAAGIHAEILNLLQKIPAVRVIPRRSVLKYQESDLSINEIANELNVSTIMDGSVRIADNQVRINLQLVRASDESILWVRDYNFEFDDIFAIQSDVARQVANALEASLLPEEIAQIEHPAAQNFEAYRLYLQHWVRYENQTDGFDNAFDEDGWASAGIRDLSQAVDLDPEYARGLGELGWFTWAKWRFSTYEDTDDLLAEATSYANRALESDPTTERAYVTLARVAFERRQWVEWERYSNQSVELPDLNGRAALNFALTLGFLGRYEEAYDWHEVAISKNQSLLFNWEYAIRPRIWGEDYVAALRMAEHYRTIGGDENAYHIIRAFVFTQLGRQVESADEFSQITDAPLTVSNQWVFVGMQNYLRCQSGEYESVLEELGPVTRLSIYFPVLMCALGAGDVNKVFDTFQTQMDVGRNIDELRFRFVSDEVRVDPRWQKYESYMNLPPVLG